MMQISALRGGIDQSAVAGDLGSDIVKKQGARQGVVVYIHSDVLLESRGLLLFLGLIMRLAVHKHCARKEHTQVRVNHPAPHGGINGLHYRGSVIDFGRQVKGVISH